MGELAQLFGLAIDETDNIVRSLLKRGIVRKCRNGEDEQNDISSFDLRFKFDYVGLVISHNLLITSYPKYFLEGTPDEGQLRCIFRVLRRQSNQMQRMPSFDLAGDSSDDQLSLTLKLLDLYGEYGEYTNYVGSYELNGPGTIDWSRTIALRQPILIDNEPIYVEYDTRKRLRDETDYITRLHRCMLTACSKDLRDWGVADLLSLDDIYLTDEEIGDFGGTEVVGKRLEQERSRQFVTWKLTVLDVLERLVLKRDSPTNEDELECLGTTSFYAIWEGACKVAYGDMLDKHIDELDIDLSCKWYPCRSETLLSIIPHPKWTLSDQDGSAIHETATLIPDVITLNSRHDDTKEFCIYDAKYYVPKIGDGSIEKQPGVESVTKQFLYQSAYKDFIKDHETITSVKNIFLLPTTADEPHYLGHVSFPGVIPEEESPLCNQIDVWQIPAEKVFDAYLENRQLDKEDIV